MSMSMSTDTRLTRRQLKGAARAVQAVLKHPTMSADLTHIAKMYIDISDDLVDLWQNVGMLQQRGMDKPVAHLLSGLGATHTRTHLHSIYMEMHKGIGARIAHMEHRGPTTSTSRSVIQPFAFHADLGECSGALKALHHAVGALTKESGAAIMHAYGTKQQSHAHQARRTPAFWEGVVDAFDVLHMRSLDAIEQDPSTRIKHATDAATGLAVAFCLRACQQLLFLFRFVVDNADDGRVILAPESKDFVHDTLIRLDRISERGGFGGAVWEFHETPQLRAHSEAQGMSRLRHAGLRLQRMWQRTHKHAELVHMVGKVSATLLIKYGLALPNTATGWVTTIVLQWMVEHMVRSGSEVAIGLVKGARL